MNDTIILDWARGDFGGLDFPAHAAALKAGGCEFLTRAFRASGVLSADNEVTAITRLDEWVFGGAGAKAMMSVAYAYDEPGLSPDLFVKFSRNFADRVRDMGKYVMAPEVRLAHLSRNPAFPVAVPACLYADYHHESATGIIISERIAYGQGAVESHHPKCMDHILPDPLAHYSELVSNLARLAGAHKAGRLGDDVEQCFPLEPDSMVTSRFRFEPALLVKRIHRLTDFIARYPHLAPAQIADQAFLDDFAAAAPLVIDQQDSIGRFLFSQPDMIALCHWNANIDNAWFWRTKDGALRCGLLDWGGAGQMPLAQSLSGCLCACEPDFIDSHLDELLDLFVAEYARAGGPTLDPAELARHYEMQVLMAALSMTTAPPAVLRELPDPAAAVDRYDPVFTANETARVQLKVTINRLSTWRRRDLGRHLRSGAFRRA